MSKVIDFAERKAAVPKNVGKVDCDLDSDVNKEMGEAAEKIALKYINKLRALDSSFTVELPIGAAGKVEGRFASLRSDLLEIIIELVGELIKSETMLIRKIRSHEGL